LPNKKSKVWRPSTLQQLYSAWRAVANIKETNPAAGFDRQARLWYIEYMSMYSYIGEMNGQR
jgi:hypothetical protein